MKKPNQQKTILTVTLILTLFLTSALLTSCTLNKNKEKTEPTILKQKITLITKDEITLTANHYPSNSDKGIILLHMFKKDKDSWNNFPTILQNKGYNVFTLNLRGHGESDLDINTFTPQDFQDMVKDVDSALDYLITKEIFQISIIGASMGANTAINYAAEEPRIQKTILISPALNYKGITTQKSIQKYTRPLLIITGEQDSSSKESSETLFNSSPSKKELKLYETSDHGTDLLNNNPLSKEFIIQWLKE